MKLGYLNDKVNLWVQLGLLCRFWVLGLFPGFLQLSLVKGMMMELGVGEVIALSLIVPSCSDLDRGWFDGDQGYIR